MDRQSFVRRQILDRFLYLSRRLPPGSLRTRLEISLRGLPSGHAVGCRAKRINSIAQTMHRCEDYLEIGVQYGFTLGSVAIKNKTGVDPHLMFNPRFSPGVTLHRVTSDVFFANLPREKMYDLVFLDGLHTFWQTARDFINALSHLRPGGIIVVDDVVPSSELAALPQRDDAVQRQSAEGGVVSGEWFGDVWKLPVALKEILKGSIELEVFGYGPCGQAVVRIPNPRQVLEEISEAQLGPYNSLLFSDFFPEEGVVLLPGHSHD